MARKKNIEAAPAAPAPAPQPAAEPTQKYLLNPVNGRVFAYTDALAARPGIVECTRDGVPTKAVAGRLAARAERQREIAEAAAPAVTTVPDTFGAPRNPVAAAPAAESPKETSEAGIDSDIPLDGEGV